MLGVGAEGVEPPTTRASALDAPEKKRFKVRSVSSLVLGALEEETAESQP